MPEAVLQIRGVGKDFGGGMIALQGVDLDIHEGEFVCLLGPSGCGQSTLPPMLLMDGPLGALDALARRSMQHELLRIWGEFRKTIVFVTHGIDESVIMADRVVVFTYRPGTVKEIVELRLPRPRDPAAPGFAA